ncbi:MAG: bifunctional nuclease family protein, partial [Flexistipes sinusarabici]
KKCVSKDCLQENEKIILEQLITDQATTYWNV